MDTPVEETARMPVASVPIADIAAPVALPVEAGGDLEPFDTVKAINYSVANLGASLVYGLFNFGMPLYLDSYKLPAWLIGLLANERSFVGAFVQPVVGRLSDRTRSPLGRRRPFFLVGIPLMALALMLLALHPPFIVMISIMAVAAFFLAIAWDPYMAMMADLFPPLQRGRVGGLVGLGSGLGNLAFVVLALTLWGHAEFSVFAIVTAVLVATWAYTFFTVKEPPSDKVVHEDLPKFNLSTYIAGLKRYPEVAKYTLAINFFWLGTGGAVPFLTLFATKVLGSTTDESFYLPLGAILATAIFSIPAGYLADRIGKKKTMIIGMVIYGTVALIGSQSTTLMQGILALGIIGIGNAAMAQINPMMTDLVPRKRMAEFIGLGSAVFSFSQPVGSVIAGAAVGLSGFFVSPHDTYRWAFIVSGILVLISAVMLQRVHPERPIPED